MTLNEESKNKLRQLIEKELIGAEYKERIPLETELLEQLLFKKQKIGVCKIVAKFPVWSGDFLSKIDLSGVSFENVVWNTEAIKHYVGQDVDIIDYSYTNAVIDIHKVCNLVPFFYFSNCNFTGTDLSQNEAIGDAMFSYGIRNCNFSNTGLRVKRSFCSLTSEFRKAVEDGLLKNCYLDGSLIAGDENKDENVKAEILRQYNAMVGKYERDILEAIQKAKK